MKSSWWLSCSSLYHWCVSAWRACRVIIWQRFLEFNPEQKRSPTTPDTLSHSFIPFSPPHGTSIVLKKRKKVKVTTESESDYFLWYPKIQPRAEAFTKNSRHSFPFIPHSPPHVMSLVFRKSEKWKLQQIVRHGTQRSNPEQKHSPTTPFIPPPLGHRH